MSANHRRGGENIPSKAAVGGGEGRRIYLRGQLGAEAVALLDGGVAHARVGVRDELCGNTTGT
jgi:hypothetical protein